jgi:hypothetical protein
MGVLDGGLQAIFGAAFSAVYLDGRHYQKAKAFDTGGNATGTVIKVQSVKGYRERITDAMRAAGFADNESLLMILQTFDGLPIEKPLRTSVILLEGQRWIVGDIDEDPAHVYFAIRVTRESDG